MRIIPALLSLFAISRAALIPIDSSSVVSVKTDHSGQGYSYSIHENKGFAIEPTASVAVITNPFIKTDAAQKQHDLDNGQKQKISSSYAITNVHIPTVSLIQPYVYTHPHGYAYPYNLVAVGAA